MAEPRFIEPVCPEGLSLPPKGFFILTSRDFWSLARGLCQRPKSLRLPYCRIVRQKEGFLVGPSLSAPHAIMVLETLKACNIKEVTIFGWCGSLSEDISPGEIFLPTEGLSFEGVSRHYPDSLSRPWHEGQKQLKSLLIRAGFQVKEGPVASTDAPFRETIAFVSELKKRGVGALDMEISSLMQVGQFLDLKISCALLVTDRLGDKWEDHREKTQKIGEKVVRLIWKDLCRS